MYRDKQQISGCQGLGEGQWGMAVNGYRFLFGVINVLEIKFNAFSLFSLTTRWALGLVYILKKS